jgi:tRNA threonylcarbamoyladenosine biosynthesis protein TsaB
MYLLATDTSGRDGSIALARCEDEVCDVIEMVSLEGGTFSAMLVPQISELLERKKLKKNDLDGFAVVVGPGSFTGLRIGLAAIKGLAEILKKPIVAVSLLDAMATLAKSSGRLVVAMDAGRGEFYVGIYTSSRHSASEQLMTRSDLLSAVGDSELITTDVGLSESAMQNGLHVTKIDRPRADAIARIGWKQFLAGLTVRPANLDAKYIRKAVDPVAVVKS